MHKSCFGGVARLLQHQGRKKVMGAMDPKPPTLEDVEKDMMVQGGLRGFSLFELLLFSENCNVLLQKVFFLSVCCGLFGLFVAISRF
ncbi:hypothetical protein BRADI_1g62755v3 [Brachypodium distachyon]|uniref:Uncharacterized protein n=1 Tax=Brachypodium distachyon TaxID=15368 RepID=A0A2K2DT37_BRADI|nr:hypothetical protein BRADI_1g62755v3 [Brachypodium distachyon]